MASSIDASTSGAGGVITTADNTGILNLKTAGTTAVTIDTSQRAAFVAGTAAAPAITTAGDTNTGIFFPAADTIAFAEGGTEAMRLDSSGNVGIGTASPSKKLSIATGATNQVLIGTSDTAGTYNAISLTGSALDASLVGLIGGGGSDTNLYIMAPTSLIFRTTGSTERMQINSSGSLILAGSTAQKASGTTWSNPSDQRLKDNIRDYTKGTNELMQVRVREWEYNGKGGTTEGIKGLGVVADEVITILPNTVETYDAKLNTDDEETTAIKKFDATEITWLLVKTVQEQQTIINDLKARVTALEAK
jgi:hypothetical protein